MSVNRPFGFCYSLNNSNATIGRGDSLTKAVYFTGRYAEVFTNEDSEVYNRPHFHSRLEFSRLLVARLTIFSNVRTAIPVGPFDR